MKQSMKNVFSMLLVLFAMLFANALLGDGAVSYEWRKPAKVELKLDLTEAKETTLRPFWQADKIVHQNADEDSPDLRTVSHTEAWYDAKRYSEILDLSRYQPDNRGGR